MKWLFSRLFTPKCEHESFYENMACNGICVSCGEDLGFIGNLDQSKCVAGNDPDRWNLPPNNRSD